MKKFGTPIAAGPGSEKEKVGLAAVGTPPCPTAGVGLVALVVVLLFAGVVLVEPFDEPLFCLLEVWVFDDGDLDFDELLGLVVLPCPLFFEVELFDGEVEVEGVLEVVDVEVVPEPVAGVEEPVLVVAGLEVVLGAEVLVVGVVAEVLDVTWLEVVDVSGEQDSEIPLTGTERLREESGAPSGSVK